MGASFTFDGSGDYLDYGDLNVTDSLTSVTFSFWVNSTNFTTSGGYVAKYTTYGNSTASFYVYDDTSTAIQVSIFGNVAGNSATNWTHGMSTGIWYHIVITWAASRNATNSGYEIYLNGVKQTLSSSSGNASSINSVNSSNLIGGLTSSSFQKNGKIAYVRFFNRAITEAEANEMYKCINHISNGLIFQADLLDTAGKEIYTQTSPTIGGNAAPDPSGPPVFFPTLCS